MKKYVLVTFTLFIALTQNLLSQNYNPDYAFTVFYDDFNGTFDTSKWNAHHGKQKEGSFYIWVNTPYTVFQSGGNLNLQAIHWENYTVPHEYIPDSILVADYISGEVQSYDDFTYGIFECCATFEYNKGAFPSFWLYNDDHCYATPNRPEIDIVEMKYDEPDPTLDYNIFYYGCNPISPSPSPVKPFKEYDFNWTEVPHIFKCTYTPSKITFETDGNYDHTYVDQGQVGYPDEPMHIRLSQQLVEYNNTKSGMELPSKSKFHWVKVKYFFMAPSINCTSQLCTGGYGTLSVDARASNITWSLTPVSLFSGATTGSGKSATFYRASNECGMGKIIYTFEMPSVISGETFTAEETFWVGEPYVNPNSIIFENSEATPGSLCANAFGNNFSFTYDHDFNYFNVKLTNLAETQTICSFTIYDTQGDLDMCSVNEGTYMFWVRGNNDCGTATNWSKTAVTFEDCGGMMMMMAPNPTSGETIISLEPKTENTTFDENEGWDVEIYSETMQLKDKKDKLKTKDYKVKTNDWKEGVYTVRAKYKEQILTGKLVVKK